MISIIIPVYNGEKTIERSISSVRYQTYSDVEIIVADDGSTDNTGMICRNLEKQDTRIRYFYQKNQGVVAARALGLRHSKGEYIGFVDADDDIESTMFEKLLQTILKNHTDIAVCGYSVISESEIREEIPDTKTIISGEEEILRALMQSGIQGFLCNKLFKKRLIQNRYFHYEMKMCEDLFLLCEMLAYEKRMTLGIIKEPLYHYYVEKGSATHDYGRLISESGEWIPLQVYKKIEKLFLNPKSIEIIQLAEASILKLALEQLRSQKKYSRTYEKLIQQSKKYREVVWKSKWSVRNKISWLRVTKG